MFRRFGRRGLANNASLAALGEAQRAMAAGQPLEAALIFSRLAGEMEGAGYPVRAANLHAQAAHAFADARDGARALEQARTALRMFIQLKMDRRAAVFLHNISQKLRRSGMVPAADALLLEFEKGLPPVSAPQMAADPHRGRLPAACPKCGGPVRSDEVDWVDSASAECVYCGAILQAE
jgi:hypothetical protein